MRLKKAIGLCGLSGLFFFLLSCQPIQSNKNFIGEQHSQAESSPVEIKIKKTNQYGANRKGAKDNEQKLETFVAEKLTGDYGIYTNYLDTDQNEEVATGHEVLSESAGLMLRYAALKQDETLFKKTWEKTVATFNESTQFSYRFSPKLQKRYPVNASVDDLRIIRGLAEAQQFIPGATSENLVTQYGSRFYKKMVNQNKLVDFRDSQYDITNKSITLCYIDLKTLSLLPIAVEDKKALIDAQEMILTEGYLGDQFPFYQTRYDYTQKAYIASEEINVIESLLSILHLSEAGKTKSQSIAFIKENVEKGTLYNRYSKTGEVLDQNQSAAVYGICAMIASEVGDEELYNRAMDRMEASQIHDPASPLNGGYGDSQTNALFSFNNLIALLAYQY
ncbi:MAG: hypothetical protein ACRCTN_10575 [Carnobacterium maltaromaticum]